MLLLSPMMTRSGWVYGIAAPWSPDHGVIGYPMYRPDPDGTRQIRGRPYHKYRRTIPTAEAWSQPYIHASSIDPWAACIPQSEVLETADVIAAFQDWRTTDDPRKGIVTRVLQEAGVPSGSVGLGGSTCLGCNQPDADLDLLIFGTEYVTGCIRAIEQTLLDGGSYLMSPDIASAYAGRYGKLYDLPPEFLFHIFAQDLTKIYVGGRKISFIFTYGENEVRQIPQRLYLTQPTETVQLKARVVSNVASWFYPRKYLVQTANGNLYSVWSHHWLHKAMALPGTLVEVVADKINPTTLVLTHLHHRILPLRG